MKKLICRFLILILMLSASSLAEDDFVAGYAADMAAIDGLKAAAEAKIQSFESILYGAKLDSLTINPNYGTDESGDFIALVYMVYDDATDPRDDVHTLIRVSNNIAHAIIDSVPGAVELCVFWDLPGYASNGKVAYTIDADGYHYGDTMLPKALAIAWNG